MRRESCCGEKPFSPGFWLKAWILVVLGKEELHGYELMSKLEEFFPNLLSCCNPSHMGRGYKVLRMLEMEGFIQSRWETGEGGPAKRIYSLTEKGGILREEIIKSIEDNIDFLKKFIEIAKGGSYEDSSCIR